MAAVSSLLGYCSGPCPGAIDIKVHRLSPSTTTITIDICSLSSHYASEKPRRLVRWLNFGFELVY